MPKVFIILVAATLLSGCSYKGSELWRRSTCDAIVDVDERAQCLEEATRSENEYKRDVEAASGENIF